MGILLDLLVMIVDSAMTSSTNEKYGIFDVVEVVLK
jgi:hypothetical protein